MATVITMPRLSDTMTEGTVATWLKKVGDKINEGDILAEIETDKATMEFESFNEGTLLHIGIQEGGTAPVDSLLAIIGKEGEDISGLLKGEDSKGSTEAKTDEAKAEEKSESNSNDKEVALPEGVIVVTMPRLSDTMTDGTVATWLKKVGDTIKEGDILCFKNAGAYCFSMSSNYNSRFKPAEVLIYEGKDYLIRKEESFEDLLKNQVIIDIE